MNRTAFTLMALSTQGTARRTLAVSASIALVALATGALDARGLMYLALAAYATYAINAAQFLWKLRMARLDHARSLAGAPELAA